MKKKEAEENGEGVQDFAVKGTVWKEESGQDREGRVRGRARGESGRRWAGRRRDYQGNRTFEMEDQQEEVSERRNHTSGGRGGGRGGREGRGGGRGGR